MAAAELLAGPPAAALYPADEGARQHHLLRHTISAEERGTADILRAFDCDSVAEAFKAIKKMSQRDLQAKFKTIYGAKTFSNNNNWLRRKLFEAIGVDPAKGAGKKPAGGAAKRRKAPAGGRPAPAKKAGAAAPRAHFPAPAYLHELDNSAAEALLALGDIAAMELEQSEEAEASLAPTASTGTGTSSGVAGVAPSYRSGEGGEPEGAADRMVPEAAEAAPEPTTASPFLKAQLFLPAEPAASAGSPRSGAGAGGAEEEGETEPAPAGVAQALALGALQPGSRAASSTLGPLAAGASFGPAELAEAAANAGQLYSWLVARQQQAAAAAAGAGAAPAAPAPGALPVPPMLPPMLGFQPFPFLPPGAAAAAGAPWLALPPQMPAAPPLFAASKGN